MKRVLRSLTALLLTLALLPLPSLAAFSYIREYPSFSDVSSDHWGHSYVTTCYMLGLMSGTGGNCFSPSGTLSVAEAVTVAVRLNDLYRGGDGITAQGGANWYDGAVNQALSLGIITQGQFSSYVRPATRAELAGLLASALPESEFKAINTISSLPDVDGTTPYSAAIFKLYNAGILTGSDGYGTFTPNQSITRIELAAILCRLAKPDTRVILNLASKAADTTVRATSRKLFVNGIPLFGVVAVGNQFCIPGEVLDDDDAFGVGEFYETSSAYELSFIYYRFRGEIPTLSYWSAPPSGKIMGTAAPSSKPLEYDGRTIQGAVYTLGGRYPMISLNALGATTDGTHFYLNTGADPSEFTLVPENDLAGGPVPSLIRSTDRETVIAIHDYLVNTLTYDPLVAPPRGISEAALDAADAAQSQAAETYRIGSNITLASKYAICQDYAELFRSMCTRAGIPCLMITGTAGGDGHAWNMVYVDGKWLYVDCTWDDPVSLKPVLNHTYCLVGPDVMVRSHYWEGDDYPMPKEYDPAWANLDPNNITSADMFRKCLVAQAMQHKTFIRLRTVKSGSYGGIGCLYAYGEIGWCYFSGGYNKNTGTYDYTIEYW